jgi:hypothetical protein
MQDPSMLDPSMLDPSWIGSLLGVYTAGATAFQIGAAA